DFINFTLSIASRRDETLRPVYSVVPTEALDERTAPDLEGYRGDGPVRIGNAAAGQAQHDTYGSIILAATPMFFDRRLPRPGDDGRFGLLESVGERAVAASFHPDAGISESHSRHLVRHQPSGVCCR